MTILSKSHVLSTFQPLLTGDATSFFANVVDDVDWIITGSSHPLAKQWQSKEEVFQRSWKRIGAIMRKPMQLSVVSVLVEPAEAEGIRFKGRAVVELRGVGGVLKDGTEYNNEYCWIVGFNEDGKISSVKAYLDSAKVRDALGLEGNTTS